MLEAPPLPDREVLDKLKSLIEDLDKFEVDIRAALAYSGGSHSFGDVILGVLNGTYHFYDFGDAYAIMEVRQYPRKQVYSYFLAGGNMDTLLNHVEDMKKAAKSINCSALEIRGRAGWERACKPHGFSVAYTALSVEV